MSNYLKVEGHDSLVRDPSTMAIVNTDRNALIAYQKKKQKLLDEKERISRHEQEINNIKSDISEIKQMLLTMLKDR